MEVNKSEVLKEIKGFLDGNNNELKYLVNVETNPNFNYADCVIHEPNESPKLIHYIYTPFLYIKDFNKNNIVLYDGDSEYEHAKQLKYGITIDKLETGGQKRLLDGYCYKISSTKSFNAILNYLKDGGLDVYEKRYDEHGKPLKDKRGFTVMPKKDLVFYPNLNEQFFISTGVRLYKGFEEYKEVHRMTIDIETTGLRYPVCRVFAIGIRDNRGFEKILEVEKINDDISEGNLISDMFHVINYIKPAVILGHNLENFDIDFILGRAKILGVELAKLPTTLNEDISISRKGNTPVKYGNKSEKYTSTKMWGYSIIDTLHAAKRTAAVNTDLEYTNLKYVAKFENIAKPNRTYIKGDDGLIGKYYLNNNIFIANDDNDYLLIPDEFQDIAKKFYKLQINKSRVDDVTYKEMKKMYGNECPEFIKWFKENGENRTRFVSGKNLVKQYLADDLYETEQVDELYNQSSFLQAKIIPTTYHRICTMGTASVWNLLLTTWSYENNIAIPICDVKKKFSGGLARCFRGGYCKRIKKIDFASLYPMIQLSEDVFPMFDITGVIKKMLLYLTTTRNIYKKLANSSELESEEIELFKEIDHEAYLKYINNELTDRDRAMFKVKQLPIKILNNSLFGALGADISFNWSDNRCAARITCTGRIHLRHAINFFEGYGCIALLAVTDGINFSYPEKTKIIITDDGVTIGEVEGLIEDMWKYKGKVGMEGLIEKFNTEEMKSPFMKIDDDGDSLASLNLSRINYANLVEVMDKKTGKLKEKVKLTGNTIKSKTMPEYMADFIDKGLNLLLHGKGNEFVDYYYDYCDDIRYMQIPLKKIASKKRVNKNISAYLKRGKNKNGRDKGAEAHMELLIEARDNEVLELYEKYKDEFILTEKQIEKMSLAEKYKLVENYLSPEPELDTMIYYINTGYKKSHGDSRKIKDKETGVERFCARIIKNEDLINNPNLTGEYNYAKYLDAFNKRVKSLLVGFKPEIRAKILTKLDRKDRLVKNIFLPEDLELINYKLDDMDEAMHLQPKEVEYWNETGYDPRLVWNGFKMSDNVKVYYEIYEEALNFLNNMMRESNKPLIKSSNEELYENDMVLIKENTNYSIGKFNGSYIQIIRDGVDIPKHEIEIRLEEERNRRLKIIEFLKGCDFSTKLDDIEVIDDINTDDLLTIDDDSEFISFKKEYNIPNKISKETLFSLNPEIKELYVLYLKENDSIDNAEYEPEVIDIDEVIE